MITQGALARLQAIALELLGISLTTTAFANYFKPIKTFSVVQKPQALLVPATEIGCWKTMFN
jgi:hypothetical protein